MKRWQVSHSMWKRVCAKTDARCWYCGIDTRDPEMGFPKFHVDHILPLSKGGDYSYDNLVPACSRCNTWKADKTVEEFRDEVVKLKPELLGHTGQFLFEKEGLL